MYFQHITKRIVKGDQIALNVRDLRGLNDKSLDYWISLDFFFLLSLGTYCSLWDLAVLFYAVIILWMTADSVESLLVCKHNSEHLMNEMFVLSDSD